MQQDIDEQLQDHTLWACADLVQIDAGLELELFYRKDTNVTCALPRGTAAILKRCERWRSLDHHAQEIASAIGTNGTGDTTSHRAILEALKELAHSGLLMSHHRSAGVHFPLGLMTTDTGLSSTQWKPASERELKVRSLAVPTEGRPSLLHRCLRSFLQNAAKSERALNVMVADDSDNPVARRDILSALASIRAESRSTIAYVGDHERSRFAAELSLASGVPPELVRFALRCKGYTDRTTGGNRNTILLALAGQPAICADDDVVCRLTRTAPTGLPIVPARAEEYVQFSFYPTFSAALDSNPAYDVDACAIHESMLGCTHVESLDCIEPSLCSRLAMRRVAVTYAGILGDNAYRKPTVYLLLRGAARSELLKSETFFHQACLGRQVLRAMSRSVISEHAFSTTTFIGLDLRTMLPPFLPTGRDQDASFGMLIRKAFPDFCFGHVPYAIQHSPSPERRESSIDTVWEMPEFTCIRDLFSACLALGPQIPQGLDPSDSLQMIGHFLRTIGALPIADFRSAVLPVLIRNVAAYIGLIDHTLGSHGEMPHYWAHCLRLHRDSVLKSIESSDYWIPYEIVEQHGVVNGAERARSLIAQFGALLEAWPALWGAAIRLRDGGLLDRLFLC